LKRKKNKAVIIILSVLAFVILAASVFYGTYYFIIDKSSTTYESDVKDIVNKVNDVNISVAALNKGQAIDAEKVRKELSGKIDNLSKYKQNLSDVTVTDNYKKDHQNLIAGIDKNILILRQIDAIARNSDGRDIDKAGEDLIKYRDETVASYALVNIKNIKVELPKDTITFIEYTSNYVNELVKLHRDKEISQNQNLEFINSTDALVSKFVPIKVDYATQMAAVRTENGNKDNVISLANKNKDLLDGIEQEFANLTVPSKAVNCYKLFKKTLEDYDSYIQSFIYAANNEKLSGSDLSSDKITEIYSESTNKFSTVTKDYNDFLKSYSEFRQSTSQ
jgi:hypothetical protein